MAIKFNPLSKTHKSVIGGVKENTNLKIFVETDHEKAYFCIYQDEKPVTTYEMQRQEKGYFVNLKLKKGLYFYPEN